MNKHKEFKCRNDQGGSGSGSGSMHAVPPPSSLGITGKAVYDSRKTTSDAGKKNYSSLESINQFTSSQSLLGKRKICTEDDYFDDDDEQLAEHYKPAPGSPGPCQTTKRNESDEEDPLDAFMAGIEQQVKKESVHKTVAKCLETIAPIEVEKLATKGVRADIDEEDDEESYYRYMEENPNAGLRDDGSDVEMEYDADGNPLPTNRKKDIDPLPPIYHSEIEYEPFEKNFYVPHEEINDLTEVQVHDLRKTLGVKVSGPDPCKPVTSFGHFGFPEPLMKAIRRAEFTQPSAIQAQAVPVALSGRDLIGIAKTGSGKTAAFIWPLLVHIIDQRELKSGILWSILEFISY